MRGLNNDKIKKLIETDIICSLKAEFKEFWEDPYYIKHVRVTLGELIGQFYRDKYTIYLRIDESEEIGNHLWTGPYAEAGFNITGYDTDVPTYAYTQPPWRRYMDLDGVAISRLLYKIFLRNSSVSRTREEALNLRMLEVLDDPSCTGSHDEFVRLCQNAINPPKLIIEHLPEREIKPGDPNTISPGGLRIFIDDEDDDDVEDGEDWLETLDTSWVTRMIFFDNE
jgi:hypothetical protein